jgi:propanol-preferring alcohol dehydrogenase
MKAAVVHQFGEPLAIEQVPVPEPGPGEVIVRIEAAGLCHTDIHAANGDWPVKPKLPLIPGHEGVGLITALGAGVTAAASIARRGGRPSASSSRTPATRSTAPTPSS